MVHLPEVLNGTLAGRNNTRMVFGYYHSVQLTCSMVNLPVSMVPEWYLEIPFITIEYQSISMVHLPVSYTMMPEWYLEILLITTEYHSVPLKFSMVHFPASKLISGR